MSTTVPAWVPVLAVAISILALFVSAGSLAVAYRAHKAGHHNVAIVQRYQPDLLCFEVVNRGRGPVDITSLVLHSPRALTLSEVDLDEGGHMIHGERLPYRLEGNSRREWQFDFLSMDISWPWEPEDAKERITEWFLNRFDNNFEITVGLGDGTELVKTVPRGLARERLEENIVWAREGWPEGGPSRR